MSTKRSSNDKSDSSNDDGVHFWEENGCEASDRVMEVKKSADGQAVPISHHSYHESSVPTRSLLNPPPVVLQPNKRERSLERSGMVLRKAPKTHKGISSADN